MLGFPPYWPEFQGSCQRLTACFKHIRKQHLWQAYRWWLGELVLPTCQWNHLTTEVFQVMLASVNRCACQSHLHFSYSPYFQTQGEGGRCVEKSFLLICVPGGRRGSAAGDGWQVMCAQPPLNSCWDLHKLFYNMLHIGKLGRLRCSNEQALAAGSNQSRGDWRSTRAFSNVFVFVFTVCELHL